MWWWYNVYTSNKTRILPRGVIYEDCDTTEEEEIKETHYICIHVGKKMISNKSIKNIQQEIAQLVDMVLQVDIMV